MIDKIDTETLEIESFMKDILSEQEEKNKEFEYECFMNKIKLLRKSKGIVYREMENGLCSI